MHSTMRSTALVLLLLTFLACTPQEPFTISIIADPWAYVTIAGHVAEEETPVMSLELPAGKYEVILDHPPTGKRTSTNINGAPGEQWTCLGVIYVEDSRAAVVSCKR